MFAKVGEERRIENVQDVKAGNVEELKERKEE